MTIFQVSHENRTHSLGLASLNMFLPEPVCPGLSVTPFPQLPPQGQQEGGQLP